MSKSLALLLLLLTVASCRNLQSSATGNGAYYTGTYSNAFESILGKTSTEINASLEDAFNKIFYWSEVENATQYRAYDESGDLAYTKDSQGYVWIDYMATAMMATVQMNRKGQFDKLWNFIQTYLVIGSGQYQGYYVKKASTNGTSLNSIPSFFAEQTIATALFFAGNRWGDTSGIYNYTEYALDLLNLFRSQTSIGTYLFDPTTKMVTSGLNTNQQSGSNVVANFPAYYDIWAVFDSQNSAFWTAAATTSRALLDAAIHSVTGLTTPKAYPNGTTVGNFVRNNYWFISNVAIDQYWWGLTTQSWEIDQANNIQQFFIDEGIDTYGNKYSVSGYQYTNYHDPALVFNNAVTSLSSTSSSNSQEFLQQIWDFGVPTGYDRRDSFRYLICMLQCSGNFKIYQ